MNITLDREKLINIIAMCGNKDVRRNWIIELSESEIECTESQCEGCPIACECIEILSEKKEVALCQA